jgi:hypothetical protein
MRRLGPAVAVLLIALWAISGHASVITLSPAGNGVYLLDARSLYDVSGLEISLAYDASVLSNPRVVQGGLMDGALMMTNTGPAGSVRIAMVRQSPVEGSGPVATILFDRGGAMPGNNGVSGLSARTVSSAGQVETVATELKALTEGGSSAETAGEQPTDEPAGAAGGQGRTTVLPIVVPLPGPVLHQEGSTPAVNTEDSDSVRTDAPATEEPPAAADDGTGTEVSGEKNGTRQEVRRVLTQKGALERFRDFRGPWTVEETLNLFQQDPLLGCSQEPQVVIADGKATVKLTVVVSPAGSDRPGFALQGGAILSAAKDGQSTNTWVLEARPDKGVDYASLQIDDGVIVREVPLTVAPVRNADRDGSGAVTERDLQLHLRGRQGRNGSGLRGGFLDDYRFVANYLAAVRQGRKEQDGGTRH